ncbi:SRPBCC domain-containing protein [Arthrobacter sp. ISL-30]|uniref:SRPBCC family protein n=1 Tax=Arthrobacter sp. ISL-30 TaxID=2819109 RepID=UPI001BE944A5|nr:SRPBCC domain-containing protein [Arthrobacter sp. ISL-30]MBT2515658.1 SRPBCC domain-containing protein [Arthrobacter sp. ISL-30]
MTDQSTTITLAFDQSPEEVFNAVTNVRGWWSKNIQGGTVVEGDEFAYEVPDVHSCRVRVTEVVPKKRVNWRVLDNTFSFVGDQEEWIDTEIHFEISTGPDGKTELAFNHVGLIPEFECYEICHKSWRFYVGHSLRDLIATGTGQPNEVADGAQVLGPRIDAALA